MEILVFGAGAIGGYLGGKLALAGHQVTLVNRPDTAAAVNAEGLLLSEGGASRRAPVMAAGSLADVKPQTGGFDLIILGTKAYDLPAAAAELAAICPQPAQVMATQNGIGIEEIVAAHFGAERALAGTVTIPISREGPNRLAVQKDGRGVGIAPVAPGRNVDEWVALFQEAGIRSGALADYRAMKWSKAFLNIMGNASSAILNRPPAELYRLPEMFDLEMRMLREMLDVMRRLKIEVVNLPGATARPLAGSIAFAPRFLQRLVFSQVIIHGRGDKMPSFHIDLAAGKGRSEVEFHNGAIAAAGAQVGVVTPVNAALNDVLLALTRDRTRREYFDGRPDRLLAVVRDYERGEVYV